MMIARGDGVIQKNKNNQLTLIKFGEVSDYYFNAMKNSLKQYLDSLNDELLVLPDIVDIYYPNPQISSRGREEKIFYREMDAITGKIILGITRKGIYNENVGRNLFGFGNNGLGLLSTNRFENEFSKLNITRDRLKKEVIKIFSLAVGLTHCIDSNCIISYHSKVTDLDSENCVCERCRDELITSLNYYLKR